MMHIKTSGKYIFGIGLNVLILYFLYQWFVKNIHMDTLMKAFEQIPFWAVVVSVFCNLSLLWFYAKRVSLLMEEKILRSFAITLFGFGGNNLLPFRMGDLVKLYYAKKFFLMSASKLLFVHIIERVWDLMLLLIMGAALFYTLGDVIDIPFQMLILSVGLIGGLAGCLFVMWQIKRKTRLYGMLLKYSITRRAVEIFETVMTGKNIFGAFWATLGIWGATVAGYYFYFDLTFPDASLTWFGAMAMVFLSSMTLSVPTVPGSLGLFEAAIVFYLTQFLSIPAEQALASALVVHMTIAIPQIILFFGCLLGAKITNAPKGDEKINLRSI